MEDPKEFSHLDYKYLRTIEGPLIMQKMKKSSSSDKEINSKSLDTIMEES